MNKLYAVYLGGDAAPKSNTELHDVVFVVGETIEACYPQLLNKWFGTPQGLHLDVWWELDVVDGHRISLHPDAPTSEQQLYFVNMGAYAPGKFTELHESAFLVSANVDDVKARAKASLCVGLEQVHKDDLYEIDDCIAIDRVDDLHVHLTPTTDVSTTTPHCGYHIIPQVVIDTFIAQHASS